MAGTTPRDGNDARTSLIETAIRVFAERGFDQASVQEIAREAGYTTGAIYSNFQSKAQLLAEAIAQHRPETVASSIRELAQQTPTADAAINLIRIVLGGPPVRSAETLVLDGLAIAARNDKVAESLQRQTSQLFEPVRELVERGRQEGVITTSLTMDTHVYLMQVILFGAMAMKAMSHESIPSDQADELARRLFTSLAPEAGHQVST